MMTHGKFVSSASDSEEPAPEPGTGVTDASMTSGAGVP